MNLNDDSVVLICGPSPSVAGSKIITCSCGHPGAISPAGQEAMEQAGEKAVTICIPCLIEHPVLSKILKTQGANLTPRQRKELNEEIGVAEVDQMMSQFGIRETEI